MDTLDQCHAVSNDIHDLEVIPEQQTHVVLAHSTLSQVQDVLSRSMTLEEYLRWDSLQQAPSLTQSLEADAILRYVMARRNTSLPVAAIARQICGIVAGALFYI